MTGQQALSGEEVERMTHARVSGALSMAAYNFQQAGDREGAVRLRELAVAEWELTGEPRRPFPLDDPEAGGPK